MLNGSQHGLHTRIILEALKMNAWPHPYQLNQMLHGWCSGISNF